jgi:hypothetical protein
MPQLDLAVFLPKVIWFLSMYYLFFYAYSKFVWPRIAKQLKLLSKALERKHKILNKRKNEKFSFFLLKKNKVMKNLITFFSFYSENTKKYFVSIENLLKD